MFPLDFGFPRRHHDCQLDFDADTRSVVLELRNVSLVAEKPSPMAGAAEGVWLDHESIHLSTTDRTIAGS